MKFFFYSKGGNGIGMALRVKEEGNQVWVYVKDPASRENLKGLVDYVSSPSAGLVQKPDCIVFDMVGHGALADSWIKAGYNVIGAGRWHDRMEYDRAFAMKFAEQIGIKVPPYKSFTNVKDAIEMVKKTKKRYVLKPDDNAGGTALTYVSRGPDDMIRFLEWAEKKTKQALSNFLLQEFIDGIEISTEVWFSKGTPVYPSNGTIELKKFMPGNVGPNTGCMASIVWPYHPKEPRIVQQTIKKMYPALRAIRFTGPLDVNSLVDNNGKAWFLEFTPRFGYSAIYALAELLNQDFGRLLVECANGKLESMNIREEFGLSLRLSMPPFPLDPRPEHAKVFSEIAGRVVSKFPKGHTYLLDVKLEDGELVTTGIDGVICEVTYSGRDLMRTTDKLYEMVKKIEIPDCQYRNDCSNRAMEELPKLRNMGYEVPSVYDELERNPQSQLAMAAN